MTPLSTIAPDDASMDKVRAAARSAMSSINTQLALWRAVQNVWYGLSLGSVLLLAAIGLAITFGVMGIINMAHGEMVMIGAYTTYVVQEIIRTYDARPVRRVAVHRHAAGLPGLGRGRHRDRAARHPPPLRPAARNVARHLGHLADPAAGGAHNLRAEQQGGRRASLHGRFVPPRRAGDHLRPHVDHRLHDPVFFALQVVLRATPFGLRMRAVTQNRRMASAMGISTGRIDALAFGLGSGIAGIAGVAL